MHYINNCLRELQERSAITRLLIGDSNHMPRAGDVPSSVIPAVRETLALPQLEAQRAAVIDDVASGCSSS